METDAPSLSDFHVYTDQNLCDNTLDDAQLAIRCPLDNGQVADEPARSTIGQLDQLPAELILSILPQLDIPSLISFRRVNRRAMQCVDSVSQYAALVRHCPDIIRAILSIQADAYSCDVLYRTLSTTQCSTCQLFGDHLYLIACRRVCYFCFVGRPEYLPLTIRQASSLFTPSAAQKRKGITARRLLYAANVPSVLSLPGRYCTAWRNNGGYVVRKRALLYDRRAVAAASQTSLGPAKLDKAAKEPRRFMSIITAPHLHEFGQQAEWGFFCLGCQVSNGDGKHYRIKFTKNTISKHVARHGPVTALPNKEGRYTHSPPV